MDYSLIQLPAKLTPEQEEILNAGLAAVAPKNPKPIHQNLYPVQAVVLQNDIPIGYVQHRVVSPMIAEVTCNFWGGEKVSRPKLLRGWLFSLRQEVYSALVFRNNQDAIRLLDYAGFTLLKDMGDTLLYTGSLETLLHRTRHW